jgi:DNA repair protein RecO (recombination protein O)
MLQESEAIVLRTRKFQESSLILTLYTYTAGRLDCLAKGVRSPQARRKHSRFQAGAILYIVYYYKAQRELQPLSESQAVVYQDKLFTDPVKILYNYLIVELFQNAVKEYEPNPPLYSLLRNTLTSLETIQGGYFSLLVRLMVELTRYLGIQPAVAADPEQGAVYFAEEEGMIRPAISQGEPSTALIARYLQQPDHDPPVPKALRRPLLYSLMRYYELHLEGFQKPKSLGVFEQVFQ